MLRKILSLLVIYFVMVSQCFAVTGVPDSKHWIAAGFGGGGSYTTLFADHFTEGVVYASPDVNAPYVSTDRAENWSFLSYNNPAVLQYGIGQTGSFVQSKTNANIMYAMESVNNGGLYKSINKGISWTFVGYFKTPKPGRYIAIDQNDVNKVYVASTGASTLVQGGRVWSTTNGGTTWSELFRPFDVLISAESAEITGSTATRTGQLNNENNILKGSVVFTSASGETFTDDGNGVLVSNMGGSGTITYNNISSSNYAKYSLTFGTTPSETTVSYTVSYSPMFIHLNKAGTIIFAGRKAASGTTFVKYTIATNTITPITLTGTNATYLQDFDTYEDGSDVEHFCVGAGVSVACTADDGATWTYTAQTTSATNYIISRVAVRRKADSTITFVINREQLSSAFQSTRQRSIDSGVTWQTSSLSYNQTNNPTVAAAAGTPRMYSIISDPFDEDVFYASSDSMIWRSDNGGLNFFEKDKGAQNVVSHHVAISPNGRIFLVSMDSGVQYSDDFGTTWVQGTPSIAKGQPFVSTSPNAYGGHYWRVITVGTKAQWDAGNGKVFIAATMYSTDPALFFINYVLRSVDNGVTWTRSNVGLPTVQLFGDATWGRGYARALASNADGSVIYVGMDGQGSGQTGGMFRSTDDGATWTRLWPSTPNRVFNALAVDPTDLTGNTALFGTFRYNLYRITNALTTAVVSYVGDSNGPKDYIQEVAYDSTGRPYALTQNGGAEIYRSIVTSFGDGSGQYGTWRLMKKFSNTGLPDGLVIDPQNNNRIFVSVTEGSANDRKVWVTPNADQHTSAQWYDITGDLPVVGGCRALALNPFEGTKGFLYCASNGAAMYKLDLADSPAFTPNRTYFGGGANE